MDTTNSGKDITFGADLLPNSTDMVYDLGSEQQPWGNIYAENLHVTNGGEFESDDVLIQSTEPTSATNKIWIQI